MFNSIKKNFSSQILKKLVESNFPDKPKSSILLETIINLTTNKLDYFKNLKNNFGHLISYPPPKITRIWSKLLPYNPGSLGNWSIKGQKNDFDTQTIERQTINQIKNLLNCQHQNIEGYFTSGSTESNIYSCWLGKTKLISNNLSLSEICLLKSPLTHYSVSKAANVTFTPQFTVPLNKHYQISQKYLSSSINKLIKKKYHGFLIPLTLGYTLTGTNDNIKKTIITIRKIKQKYPQIHFYIWLDAAVSGLVLPFVKKNFSPFKYSEIESFSIDFHKVFGIPIPSATILYRSDLRKYIEKDIDYLEQKDNTLLGSRTGISPVATWYFLNSIGKKKIIKHLKNLIRKKNMKINGIKKDFPEITVITSINSINAAIISPQQAINKINNKYHLIHKKINLSIMNKNYSAYFSKLFFLQ